MNYGIKINYSKSTRFESHPYHKILLPTMQIFYFLLKLHIFTSKRSRSKFPDGCLKMWQSSSYWEALSLQLPPVTWHWFGQFKEWERHWKLFGYKYVFGDGWFYPKSAQKTLQKLKINRKNQSPNMCKATTKMWKKNPGNIILFFRFFIARGH